jgi:hypothetical protein
MKFWVSFVLMFVFTSIINAQKIKVKKTEEHSKVVGTNLYLKIPEGYMRSPAFVGWSKNNSCIVIKKTSAPFTEAFHAIEQERLKAGDVFLPKKKKLLQLNGADAVYFETKHDSLERKFLIIKANDCTYIVQGLCENHSSESTILKKSLLSSFIENQVPIINE